MNHAELTPPHSAEAEQAVLGALMLDNRVLDSLGDLDENHFYHTEYQAIFRTIKGLCTACKVADVITVHEAGGADVMTLHGLVSSVLTVAHTGNYAEIVYERWLERELLRCAGETAADAVRIGDAAEKIDRATAALTKLATRRKVQESVPVNDAVVSFLDRLQAEADGRTEVLSTGMYGLDRLLNGGLRRGELFVVGARPKMGKTAFTLQLSRNIAQLHSVLVCSQEMPVYELTARNVAALGSINLGEMRKPGEMSDASWSGISSAVEQMRNLKLTMDEQRALTLLDVRRKTMDTKRKRGCDVVVVDFLQLMAGSGNNRNEELDKISNGLKAMAGEFNVAVVLLSQLSREADKRHGPPVMTDLRDCGAIEAAADIIGLLHREIAHPLGDKSDGWKHHAALEVVQRNGAPGTVDLWFSGEYQQFKDWSGPRPSKAMASRGSRVSSSGLG